MDKQSFRKTASERRASLFVSDSEKSAADTLICKHVFRWEFLKNKKNNISYVSFAHEADTLQIIEKLLIRSYTVAVPKCKSQGRMDFYRIKSLSDLTPSKWGIPEPEESEETLFTDFSDAVCIVPGMAFDLSGNRTGYGGGFYDRFLAAAKGITSVGICYDSLIYESVPTEPHDISVDYIITEKGIMKING